MFIAANGSLKERLDQRATNRSLIELENSQVS
jgi:hypothetical protein